MPLALKFSHFGLASEAEPRCSGTPSPVQPVNRAAGLSLSSHLAGTYSVSGKTWVIKKSIEAQTIFNC